MANTNETRENKCFRCEKQRTTTIRVGLHEFCVGECAHHARQAQAASAAKAAQVTIALIPVQDLLSRQERKDLEELEIAARMWMHAEAPPDLMSVPGRNVARGLSFVANSVKGGAEIQITERGLVALRGGTWTEAPDVGLAAEASEISDDPDIPLHMELMWFETSADERCRWMDWSAGRRSLRDWATEGDAKKAFRKGGLKWLRMS